MAGRRRTGGLGDVNPQYLTATTGAAAANDYTITQINLPVTRIAGSKNKAVVVEILAVDWYLMISTIASVLPVTHLGFLSTGTSTLTTSRTRS